MDRSAVLPGERLSASVGFARQVAEHNARMLALGEHFQGFPIRLAAIVADCLRAKDKFLRPARAIMDEQYGSLKALKKATDENHKTALERLTAHVVEFAQRPSLLGM